MYRPLTVLVLGASLVALSSCGHDQRQRLPISGEPMDPTTTTGGSGGAEPLAPPGQAVTIPATIEAENFVRFSESDAVKEGAESCVSPVSPYVDMDALEEASGGCFVGWTIGGEWLEYDIWVGEDGAFDFTLSLATQLADKTVTVAIDGAPRGTITLPATDWHEFESHTIEGVGLTAGSHVLKLIFDTGAANVDFMRIEEASACIPLCENRSCGDDFCGQSCGTCDDDQTCSESGQCIGPFVLPVVEHGHLSVKNGRIENERGEPIVLRGVSTQWLNWDPHVAGNADNMRFMRDDWGLEVYRIANGIEGYNGYLDTNVRTQRLERVVQIIEAAIELDIYVIVDWHTHEIEHKELAQEFFTTIATRFGDTPNVIYEVFNEPVGDAAGVTQFWENELKPYHEELVATIREVDPDNLIVLGTPRWAQNVDVAAANPVEGDNLLYTLHFYSCSHTAWLRDRAKAAIEAGIALFVTEWGSTHADGGTADNPGVCLTEAQAWHAFMDENGISSTAWKLTSDGDSSSILVAAPASGPWTDEHLSEHGRFVREVVQR